MALRPALLELDEHRVTDHAVQLLQKRINEKSRAPVFACKLCGEYETAMVTEPGASSIRKHTCADASEKKACKTPATPQPRDPPLSFSPGSLVLAPLCEGDDRLWPGIIEDPPSGEDLFITRGLNPDEPAQAFYHVTFIFPKNDDRKWVGGFVERGEIQPFVPTSPPPNCTDAHTQSLARANDAAFDSLQQRLMEFSFVAHIANKRGIDIHESSTASSKRTGRKRTAGSRIDPERGGVPVKRSRLSNEVLQPERSEPVIRQKINSIRVIRTRSVCLKHRDSDSD